MAKGLIFDIQRFSIHDGPGIRTTVFLKGCNMRCFWCHNPESLEGKKQLQLFLSKCADCGKCFTVCAQKARQKKNKNRVFLRELCLACGECAKACPAEALVITGREAGVNEILDEVEKDRVFYKNSGGGVTFSGGEPFLQKKFLLELLKESKKRKLHTAVETNLSAHRANIEELKNYINLFIVDIKTMDETLHKKITDSSNITTLENIKVLADGKNNIWIRIPLIPGVNDNTKEIKKISNFSRTLKGVSRIQLMPFHQLAGSKYESLGLDYKAKDLIPPGKEKISELELLVKI